MKRTLLLLIVLAVTPLSGAEPPPAKKPQVPSHLAFVRTIDIESYVQRQNVHGEGAQTFRIRTRYLDPDVNAFVGLVTGVLRFNNNLRLGDPANPGTSKAIWNWGANIGVIRGRSLWELDVMGSILDDHLAPAVALVGEHRIVGSLGLYHRWEMNLFVGDAVGDADQGLYYRWGALGVTLGYRAFAARHMSRSGPRIGFTYQFKSPKIPFIFPSIG